MTRHLKRAGLALAALLLTAFVALAVWEPFAAPDPRAPSASYDYRAEIVRDEFGVPHIYGATDADVAYGIAIAQSEDDFFTLQDVIAMTRGRYGAIAGEDGAQVDYVYHLLGARETAQRNYASLPADTRALIEAYATGLNDYAAAHPGELKLARLFPVDGVDVATGFALRQPFFFGLNNVIEPLVTGEPMNPEQGPAIPEGDLRTASAQILPGTGRGTMRSMVEGYLPILARRPMVPLHPRAARGGPPPPAGEDRKPLPMGEDAAHAGSNAFAIAPSKSGGDTLLVSNSHQPWRGGVAWYEMVVESGEGWHYAGANFPGSPYPFLGHNENLGWTNTVNTPDMVDVYKLVIAERDGRLGYMLDGRWLPLGERTVTLPVKFGPLVLPIRRTVYRSVHGPVIRNDQGYFAIRYGGMGSIEQLDAYYRLNKARDFDEFRSILSRMDIPSTNFIYGDREGNIALFYNAAIPDRPKGYDWRGILPGDESAAIWRGPVAWSAIPKLVNPASGWVMNANNTPFVAAGPGSELSPGSVPPEMGVELKMTNRARRAAKLMAAAGTIDRATLERIKYDTGYERAGYIDRMLREVAALRLPSGSDAARAQALLGRWDLTADNIGRADALALLMVRPFMGSAYQNSQWPDPREKLEEAADHLITNFGRLDPPMSELLRLRQGPGPYAVDLPLDGGSDTLRASTLWDVDEDGRLSVRHGDSFLQFVTWSPGKRVRSESIQPFGAAVTRPGSVHFTDQATLFVQHRLKPVHFWRDQVRDNAVTRKVVTHR